MLVSAQLSLLHQRSWPVSFQLSLLRSNNAMLGRPIRPHALRSQWMNSLPRLKAIARSNGHW